VALLLGRLFDSLLHSRSTNRRQIRFRCCLSSLFTQQRHCRQKKSLREQLWPFLRLFEAGKFRIILNYLPRPTKHKPPFRDHYFEKNGDNYVSSKQFKQLREENSLYRVDMFGRGLQVIPTQKKETLNQSRVEHYMNQITSEKFPIILALYMNDDELYILDGHHKFAAYEKVGIYNPVIITIQPLGHSLGYTANNGCDYNMFCENWCNGSITERNEEERSLFVGEKEEFLATYDRAFDFFVERYRDASEEEPEEASSLSLYTGK